MQIQKTFGLEEWRKSRNVLLVRLKLYYDYDELSLADAFDLQPRTVS
jgi:hypothetical protein